MNWALAGLVDLARALGRMNAELEDIIAGIIV
jgi:hypothetical protein